MANVIKAVQYTDDKGRVYVTGMDSEVFAQMDTPATSHKVGGDVALANDPNPPLPASVRPRRLRMGSLAGKVRYVTILSPSSPLWLGDETQLTIEDSDGAATVYTAEQQVSEHFGRKRRKQ